jgi:hypothetical protein
MQVSQTAYDRYVVELPPADADWRPLADPETIAETAAWLWDFGTHPLLAVVGHDGVAPGWLAKWSTRPTKWAPEGVIHGASVVLVTVADLERFLAEGAPHPHSVLIWPRVSPAKTFEALAEGREWKTAVEALGAICQVGQRIEITQVADSPTGPDD